MHTAERAKGLWCPMVRHSTETGAQGFNRGQTDDMLLNKHAPGDDRFTCTCVAEACAMWRWAGGRDAAWNVSSGAPPPMVKTEYGYCGIAGRPEAW